MRQRRLAAWAVRAFWLAMALVWAAACSHGTVPEDLGEAQAAVFTNGGFETGMANLPPPSWPVTPYLNPGITVQAPETRAGLNLQTAIAGHAAPVPLTFTLASAGGPLSQMDPFLTTNATLRWPRYGNQCAIVNQGGKNQNVNGMAQTMMVGAGDVDPVDSKVHIRFVVAPVLENPGHADNQQPYFFIQATNVTQGNAILYANFNFSNQTGVPWKTVNANGTSYVYTDWQLVDISPGAPALNMGDMVALEMIAAGCSLGGHMGQLYVDGVGSTVPGLFVSGSAPAQVNACADLTYNLTYENGAATAAAGVNVTFNTPPGTTFQSVSAPGLTCTTPAVGAAGLVTCTIGNLAAGAGGSFTVTVNVPCGTTGVITAGNYSIQGTGIESLLGPVVNTQVGCTKDSQCLLGNWCDESVATCTPTLANGTPLPTDPPHTGPTLNGTCTPAAGALVCTSAVCDPDGACGYANGDGPCNSGNGDSVCRSGVCDADGNCGYANGDGPCNASNGGTVCRSTACSVDGTCEPLGGCNVDADCTGGDWCQESTHTCTPQLANGAPIPTDPPHAGPMLTGICTAGAATLVCVSGVCDPTDNKCGYLNGDGPCTAGTGDVVCRSGVCDPDGACGYADGDGPCTPANGPTVCRSVVCSVSGVCEPTGGCDVDADCTGGTWCLESTHTCTPKLANGTPIPTDPPHTGPTLAGLCTAGAATLVCVSRVCDPTDNKCGYANGDGPCTPATGPTVCRSKTCSTGGTCEPMGGCNVDADCAAGTWCQESTHTCTPALANGSPVPSDPPHTSPQLNGTCTAGAGALTCVSGVCDTKDNDCGYANGDGPCTDGNGSVVCRSTICATSGTHMGTCVACVMDAQCPGAMPVCNTTTNTCAQCTTSAQCSGQTPVCDTTSSMCVPCNGDMGSGATDACTTSTSPFCFLGGSMTGACGKCATDSDCQGHSGNICDTQSGLCTQGCHTDADCSASDWCNGPTGGSGTCTPKLADGTPLPAMPVNVSKCTTDVGKRVCQSGACDPTTNQCGAPGCKVDSDCPSADFCNSAGTCTPKLPLGMPCTGPSQCESDDCGDNVCSGIIGSGNGLICAARSAGSGGEGGAGLLGLLLAAAGLARRKRVRHLSR